MGTMDAIRNAGGAAANFLDIGGGAQAELVKKSYNLVTSDPKVKAMFINIFAGSRAAIKSRRESSKRWPVTMCARFRSSFA